MPHAYVTLLGESEFEAAIGTIALDAVADQTFASQLKDGNFGPFAERLRELATDATFGADVALVQLPGSLVESPGLRSLVASVLMSHSVDEVFDNIAKPRVDSAEFAQFVAEVLNSTVLVEYSEASRNNAAGAVGAATAAGAGTYMAAVIGAAHLGAPVLLIAGPVGIILIAATGLGTFAITRILCRKK